MATKQELDFIVIGAQKAGTTALFEYVRRHPKVSLPTGKYAPYFSDGDYHRLDWEAYLRKTFAFADPSHKWGTVTPQYMMGGVSRSGASDEHDSDLGNEYTVPLRIHKHVPQVRLIAILRDPVERAFSHYRMAVLQGWEQRSFDQAVDELVCPEVAEQARRNRQGTRPYLTWGEYGRILSAYFDVFEEERILICFADELWHAPERAVRRIYAFLGVAADFVPENITVRYRLGSSARRLPGLGLGRTRTRWRARPWARGLWYAMPERARFHIDRVYDAANYRMDLWNRRPTADDRPSPATLTQLRAYFTEDTRRLGALLGVPLPWEQSARRSTSP